MVAAPATVALLAEAAGVAVGNGSSGMVGGRNPNGCWCAAAWPCVGATGSGNHDMAMRWLARFESYLSSAHTKQDANRSHEPLQWLRDRRGGP